MPCNGLIYAAPHPCQCFTDYKFDGFQALAAEKAPVSPEGERLTKGPAYGKVELNVPQAAAAGFAGGEKLIWSPPISSVDSEDWPTYRHDITRSGCASTKVAVDLKKKWRAKIGGRLSSIVVARSKLLVASIDRQRLHCLDAENGKKLWDFTATGRIDSPPTICGNIAIFGSLSGHVYALRLADGGLIWRFQASPDTRRTVVRDRLESLWPVHGSVLVVNGTAYFAAGRTSYIDGGIHLFALDAESGRVRHQATLTSEASAQTGALSDVLISDGRTIAMRNRRYDMSLQSGPKAGSAILKSPNGLLNDSWGHRHRWNWTLGAADTFGKLLVFDAESAYGVQAYYTFLKHDQSMHPGTHTGHLHQKYSRYTPEQFPIGTRLFARANVEQKASGGKRGPKPKLSNNAHKWNRKTPLQFRALALADDVLLGAGWKDSVKAFEKNPKKTSESVLAIISTEDGRTIKEYPLKSEPVFDGMAAARGKVYLVQKDGAVLCLGAE
ncbi:MAG: PQQ-binding-like beta-propeller repeat protein [Planctomycetota bacterium]